MSYDVRTLYDDTGVKVRYEERVTTRNINKLYVDIIIWSTVYDVHCMTRVFVHV